MSSIYLKDGIYWYQLYVFDPISQKKDDRIFRSLKTKNFEKAKSRQAKLDRQFDKKYERELLFPSRPLSICITQYLADKKQEVSQKKRSPNTYRSDDITLNQFLDYMNETQGEIDIRKISKAQILDFRVYRESLKEVTSPSTIALNLRVTRSFFSYCIENEYIEEHPFQNIKIPKTLKRDQFPKMKDLENLRHIFQKEVKTPTKKRTKRSEKENKNKSNLQWFHDNTWFSRVIWIILNTGMRIGEVTILKWEQGIEDVGQEHSYSYAYLSDDFETITIYFKRRKRELDVSSMKSLFKDIPKSYQITKNGKIISKKKIYVFENENTGNFHLTTTCSNLWKKFVVDSGLNERWTIHSLRHSVATWLLSETKDVFLVAGILGHSTLEMLDIYGHVTESDVKKALTKLHKS